MRSTTLILTLALIMTFAVGCSNDDNGVNNIVKTGAKITSTYDESLGYWVSVIDATSHSDYVYINLSSAEQVDITTAEAPTSLAWDLGFQRYNIFSNSGTSGSGTVLSYDMGETDVAGFKAVKRADADAIAAGEFQEDAYRYVFDSWYSYNPSTHSLAPTQYVYILKDAAGKYVKVQITDMVGAGMPPNMGTIHLKYIYQADGSIVFSDEVKTATIDGTSGIAYFDFSSGTQVTPADPTTSMDWDIEFNAYDIMMNNFVFGPGQTAIFPIWTGMQDPQDFDEFDRFDLANSFFMQDYNASAMTDWYDYASEKLTSKKHTYLIKSGGKVFKLYIVSYYDQDTVEPANLTVYWSEL